MTNVPPPLRGNLPVIVEKKSNHEKSEENKGMKMNDSRRIAESSREAVKLIETLPTVCANRAFFPLPRLASWYMQDLSR